MTQAAATRAGSVRDLAEVSGVEVAATGAKAATLGRLTASGLPVPAGFVIDVDAQRGFSATPGVGDEIARRLERIDIADPEARRQAAADVHVLVCAAPLPDALHEAIVDAYSSLSRRTGQAAVAVRSSPASRDTASRLLSHVNDSFLCVRGQEAMLKAVRRCWASAYGERSLTVRAKLGLATSDLGMAVIVQRQVSATRSGVMVTGDPGRDAPDRLLIDAAYGLGQGAAQGLVTPDRFSFDKRSLTVLAREVHRKDAVVEEAPPDGGTRVRAVVGEQATYPALRDREIAMLARLGAEIEELLGSPQIVEWAIDWHGRPWILQASPSSYVPTRHGAFRPD